MTDHNSSGESSEVTWLLGETSVSGTLFRPVGPGPFPAVVMVAGSGPTDRDWNSPLLPGTNGSARLLAEELAQAGIASLRYDKRASGPHARENVPLLIGKLRRRKSCLLSRLKGSPSIGLWKPRDRFLAWWCAVGAWEATSWRVCAPLVAARSRNTLHCWRMGADMRLTGLSKTPQ